jgi:hypothetical protein
VARGGTSSGPPLQFSFDGGLEALYFFVFEIHLDLLHNKIPRGIYRRF